MHLMAVVCNEPRYNRKLIFVCRMYYKALHSWFWLTSLQRAPQLRLLTLQSSPLYPPLFTYKRLCQTLCERRLVPTHAFTLGVLSRLTVAATAEKDWPRVVSYAERALVRMRELRGVTTTSGPLPQVAYMATISTDSTRATAVS